MSNTLPVNLMDPLVQEWALQRYSCLSKSNSPGLMAMESLWFHDVNIARVFEGDDQQTLLALFRTLPATRFASFVPRMLRKWPEWPDQLAGAAFPILALHAPKDLGSLVESYLQKTPADRLSPDRLVQLHVLAEQESAHSSWKNAVQQLARLVKTIRPTSLSRIAFYWTLLLNAQALEVNVLRSVFVEAWREETREHARNSLLNYLFQGLYGHKDFLDMVGAREHKYSTQRLAPLAGFFVGQAPVDTLDGWLDETPSLQEALAGLAMTGNHRTACHTLHQLLSSPTVSAQLGEPTLLRLAIAGSLQGYALDHLADTSRLDMETTLALLSADLDGNRWISELVGQLRNLAQDEVITQLTAALRQEYQTLGGVRLAKAMGILGWPEFVPPLIDALADDQGDFLCEAAAAALTSIGPAARNGLIARWDCLDRSQRIYGLSVIRAVGGAETADFAAQNLESLNHNGKSPGCAGVAVEV